ncbi:class GN sortase [Thalassotalea agariperforans]
MNWAKRFALLTIVIASIFCIEPLYLLSKATLAQYLLQQTWQQTIEGEKNIRPWPWADTYPIAKLTYLGSLPTHLGNNHMQNKQAIQAHSWIILSGMTGRTMAFGPGWLQDSAKPNQIGNTVISAHNDSHFAILENVNIGDIFQLEDNSGQTKQYQINHMRVVDENDSSAYEYHENTMITLITCYPFSLSSTNKTKRLIVTAIAR